MGAPGQFSKISTHKIEYWQTLQVFNVYRLCIAALLFIFYHFTFGVFTLGEVKPVLYGMVDGFYIIFALFAIYLTYSRKLSFAQQTVVPVVIDIIVLSILLHASREAAATRSTFLGFGILLNAAIAGGSLISGGRTSLSFASLATICLFIEQILMGAFPLFTSFAYVEMGILGATFFATATLGYGLSRRIKITEALASQRGVDLAKMEKLNEMIIQRMHSGVVVIDENDRVRFTNQAAWYLLGIPQRNGPQLLGELSMSLSNELKKWRDFKSPRGKPVETVLKGQGVLAQFITVSGQQEKPLATLIFLEDTAHMAQQAQQMKLASLGRLTASIAHEIRNPLGAISHAGELLAESVQLDANDQRLIEIICQQCKRMNEIIENVLQLSRRKEAVPELFLVKPWLEEFIKQLQIPLVGPINVDLSVDPDTLEVFMDPRQLSQV